LNRLDMQYDEVPALIKGEPVQENKEQWKEIVSSKEFCISLDLNLGQGVCEIWSNDLSEEYVNFNKSE
jgi:N-acetylglutamate synthase/N-acetylornithine aminotransferase